MESNEQFDISIHEKFNMAIMFVVWVCFFIFFCNVNKSNAAEDTFYEELYIKPLPGSHVYSYFQFTTVWDKEITSDPFDHCHLFPRALGEILQRYNVEELHISLTGGLWRHEYWGYPVIDAPPGAELWVWFQNTTINVDETWKELTSSLSGLLCASLNFINLSNSISPKFSFRPAGVVDGEPDISFLRFGTLPQEIVCTENLTPWKKLLPCDSKRGLAFLLNAGYIHNTNYHSLGIHVRNICRDKHCLKTSIELKQTVSLVHDLVIIENGGDDFSLRKLFGSGLYLSCSLANQSNIYIDVSSNGTDGTFNLVPAPTDHAQSDRAGVITKWAVYNIKAMQNAGMFNIALTYKGKKLASVKRPPVLFAHRFISGYGQQKGGIVTKLANRHWQSLNVVILENIPWFLPVYLHTLTVEANGVRIKPDKIEYIPGKQRIRPTYLEVLLKLPPRSTTTVSIQLDYVFLKWQEYPPDASHGFYVGSSVITSVLPLAKNYTGIPQETSLFSSSLNTSRDGYLVQLRTEALIITLPTPDFSMPYNVICLACTVVALAFGPIHNITTKKLRIKDVTVSTGLLGTIKEFVSSKFGKKQSKTTEEITEETQSPS